MGTAASQRRRRQHRRCATATANPQPPPCPSTRRPAIAGAAAVSAAPVEFNLVNGPGERRFDTTRSGNGDTTIMLSVSPNPGSSTRAAARRSRRTSSARCTRSAVPTARQADAMRPVAGNRVLGRERDHGDLRRAERNPMPRLTTADTANQPPAPSDRALDNPLSGTIERSLGRGSVARCRASARQPSNTNLGQQGHVCPCDDQCAHRAYQRGPEQVSQLVAQRLGPRTPSTATRRPL